MRSGASSVVFVLLLVPAAARADVDRAACVQAAERAQRLRGEGRLLAAQEELTTCADRACPRTVQEFCRRWSAEVDEGLARLAIEIEGGSDGEGELTVDGAPVSSGRPPTAIALDPGEHVVRFARPGALPAEEHVTLSPGQKDKVVVLVVRPVPIAPLESRDAAPRPVRVEMPPPVARDSGRSVPTLAYVAGGVGVAALLGFVYVDVRGQSDFDTCKTSGCDDRAVSTLRSKRAVAWTLLGVGVAGVGAALGLYLAF